MSKQRIGTLWCWLFGHKFIGKYDYYDKETANYGTSIFPVDYCVRCGSKREDSR